MIKVPRELIVKVIGFIIGVMDKGQGDDKQGVELIRSLKFLIGEQGE